MDVKLESLIAKIKQDGVEEAKKASQDIIKQARVEAEAIVREAKLQVQSLEKEAKNAATKLKANSQSSLRQASRDLVLTLKVELVALFDRILKQKCGEALTADFMKELITKIIDKWLLKGDVAWEVLVNKADKEKLEKLLLAALKNQAKATIVVKVSKSIDKGFRIGIKGEDLHYDFTDQSILEALKEFLNPSLTAILDANNG